MEGKIEITFDGNKVWVEIDVNRGNMTVSETKSNVVASITKILDAFNITTTEFEKYLEVVELMKNLGLINEKEEIENNILIDKNILNKLIKKAKEGGENQ